MEPLNDHYYTLQARISTLKTDREKHEAAILKELSQVYAISQDPALYLKGLAKSLADDGDFRKTLLKIGLNLGTNYLYKILSHPDKGGALFSQIQEDLSAKSDKKPKNRIAEILVNLISNLNTKT